MKRQTVCMFCEQMPCACNLRPKTTKAKRKAKPAPVAAPAPSTRPAPLAGAVASAPAYAPPPAPLANAAPVEIVPVVGRTEVERREAEALEARLSRRRALEVFYYSSIFNGDSPEKRQLENHIRSLGGLTRSDKSRDWKRRRRDAARKADGRA